MAEALLSFQDIVRFLSDEYNTPYEIVESILVAWTRVHYKGMLSCSSKDMDLFLDNEL